MAFGTSNGKNETTGVEIDEVICTPEEIYFHENFNLFVKKEFITEQQLGSKFPR